MSGRLLLMVSLALNASPYAIAQTPVTAQSAYDAKDWKTCAALYGEQADRAVPIPEAAYRAAACLARSGDIDGAFNRLLKSSYLARPTVEDIAQDDDLASLHNDPRWEPWLSRQRDEEAQRKAHYDTALIDQLRERYKKDQAIRQLEIEHPEDKTLAEQRLQIDRDNTAWLKTVVAKQGWPLISQIGPGAAHGAWSLVQHADLDPAFQKQVLELMKPAVAKGEASGQDFAYLTDRVLRAQGKSQIYGTQFEEKDKALVPQPIEDPDHVDERRAAIGLGTMAEYRVLLAQLYHRTVLLK